MSEREEIKIEKYFEDKTEKLIIYRETTFNPIYELERDRE